MPEFVRKEFCPRCKQDSFVDADYGLVCCSLDDGSGKLSVKSRNYQLEQQRNHCFDCQAKFENEREIRWQKRVFGPIGEQRTVAVAVCSTCVLLDPEARKKRREKLRISNLRSQRPEKFEK